MSGETITFTLLKRPFYLILAAGHITGLKFRPATGDRPGRPATGYTSVVNRLRKFGIYISMTMISIHSEVK